MKPTKHRCDPVTGQACIEVTSRVTAAQLADKIGYPDQADTLRKKAQLHAWASGCAERPTT